MPNILFIFLYPREHIFIKGVLNGLIYMLLVSKYVLEAVLGPNPEAKYQLL